MIDKNFSNNFTPNTDPIFPSPLPSAPPTIPNPVQPITPSPLPQQNLDQIPYTQPQSVPGYPQPISQSYPSTPTESSPNSFQAPPPTYQPLPNLIQNNVQATEEQEASGIVKTISVLQFLVALLYVGSTLSYLAIIILLDKSMGSGIGGTFNFVKYFPTFGFVPVVISLASIWFFFVAFKVRSSNKVGFWITSASLIVVPVIAFVCQQLVAPLLSLASGASKNVMPINPSSLRFYDSIFVLEFIVLILLIVSYKKFDLNGSALSTKAKVFLVVVTILLILPVNTTMLVKYIQAQDTDFGYTKIHSLVGFHVYRPNSLPAGLIQATKYSIASKNIADKQNTVQVAFDVSVVDALKGDISKTIVMRQVGNVTENTLANYITKGAYQDYSSPQTIDMPSANNKIGYLYTKKFGDGSLNSLLFVTKDGVLIELVSPKASSEVLVQIAKELE